MSKRITLPVDDDAWLEISNIASGVFAKPALNADRTGEVVQLELPNDVARRIETLEVVFTNGVVIICKNTCNSFPRSIFMLEKVSYLTPSSIIWKSV